MASWFIGTEAETAQETTSYTPKHLLIMSAYMMTMIKHMILINTEKYQVLKNMLMFCNGEIHPNVQVTTIAKKL